MKSQKNFAMHGFTARSHLADSSREPAEINGLETFLNGISGDCVSRHRKAVTLAGLTPNHPPYAVVNKRGFPSRNRFLSDLFSVRTNG